MSTTLLNDVMMALEAELQHYAFLQVLSEKSGLTRAQLVLGFFGVFSVYIWLSWGADPIPNVVAFAFPVYMSFKALKSPSPDDDTHWLTYWICFGVIATIESFGDFMWRTIPFYNTIKCLLFIWLFLPQTRGAQLLYSKVLEPILIRYEVGIDAELDQGFLFGKQVAADVAADPNAIAIAHRASVMGGR